MDEGENAFKVKRNLIDEVRSRSMARRGVAELEGDPANMVQTPYREMLSGDTHDSRARKKKILTVRF